MKTLKILSVLLLLVSSGLAFAATPCPPNKYEKIEKIEKVVQALDDERDRHNQKAILATQEMKKHCTDEIILAYFNSTRPEYMACHSAMRKKFVAEYRSNICDEMLKSAKEILKSESRYH